MWLAALLCLLSSCGREQAALETGDVMPYLKLAGRLEVSLQRGKWWLIAYYVDDSAAQVSRAGYIDRLTERFEGYNLSTVAVVKPNARRLILQFNESGVDYPVLIDQRGEAARSLRFDGEEDRIWFLDPDGTIRFTSAGPRIQDDDLRQLAEKFLLGQVSRYDPDKTRWMEKGDRFPETPFYDFAERRRLAPKEITDRFNRFVVFTADCAACSLNSYLMRFKLLSSELGRDGRRVAGVFSSRFSIAEVVEEASRNVIGTPLFLAAEEIRGIEDGYYLESLIAQVVVIDTDELGFVENVQPFEVWEERLTSGGEGS